MNEVIKLLMLAGILLVADLPWLYIQGKAVQDIVSDIQADRAMNVRLWAGGPVYIALAYLLTQVTSAPRAFLAGLATYAVYDFTQVVTFDKYPLSFAIMDSLWGGVLMALAWWIGSHFNLVRSNV
jgi:uncharacterized membrane protein